MSACPVTMTGYTNIVHYTDDGWSGGNFDRPAWKRLVADIEAGKVTHLLCKDLSRIGRNYLQTGFYGTGQRRVCALSQYHERMVSA